MKKKLFSLLLVASMGLSMIGCNNTNKVENEKANDTKGTEVTSTEPSVAAVQLNDKVESDETFTSALQSEPATMLHIMGQANMDMLNILGYLCDRLVDYDQETGTMVPSLATDWEYTDSTHIKFKLRDDVISADGSKLTANDVYYTFATAVEYVPTLDTGKFVDIEETQVIDDTTIILGLNEPLPDFLLSLSEIGFSIVSESAVEAAGGLDVANTKNPNVGSGKYLLSEWKQGEYMILERNENHWDKDWVGYYKNIKFVFINDSAARVMAVESGDALIANEIPMSQAHPLKGNDRVEVLTFDDGTVSQIYFNCTGGTTGIFNDKAVRQAAFMAIDKNAINQVLTAGTGELSQGIISTVNEYYIQVVDEINTEVDIEGAKQVLADAGYTGALEARAITLGHNQNVLTIVQENLRKIGIELQVDTLDTPQYVQEGRAGNYDVIFGTQTQPVRNATLFCLFDTEQNSQLIGGPRYGNAELDKQIRIAKTSADKDETRAAFKYILEEITSEYTFVGLCETPKAFVANPNIAGIKFWQRGLAHATDAYPVK